MFDLLIFQFYRFFLIPLSLFLLRILKPVLSEKLQLMLDIRSSPQNPVLMGRPIWIHASSGEIEYAKPLIFEIRKQFPEIPIFLTYFSPSALRLIKGLEGVDLIFPLPWDERTRVEKILSSIQPRLLLFSRTDVWPELAWQAHSRQIPSYLFSATLSEKSYRMRFPFRALNRFAFNQLSGIFCVTPEDQRNFSTLGVSTEVQVVGDTRFDQVFRRLQNAKPLQLPPASDWKRPLFVAGSTWPQDEAVLLPALEKFCKEKKGLLVLAPHEVQPERLTQIENQLRSMQLSSRRYSSVTDTVPENVLLIDEIGILPELYQLAPLAFVGGSFKDKVHSVMEPLAAGCHVILGPHHLNNREARHFQFIDFAGRPLVQMVSDREQFEKTVAGFDFNSHNKTGLAHLVQKNSGASRRALDLIAPQIS